MKDENTLNHLVNYHLKVINIALINKVEKINILISVIQI